MPLLENIRLAVDSNLASALKWELYRKAANDTNVQVFSSSVGGKIIKSKRKDIIEKLLETKQLRLVSEQDVEEENICENCLASEEKHVIVDLMFDDKFMNVTVYSTDKQRVRSAIEILKSFIVKEEKKIRNNVFALVPSPGGLTINSIGQSGIALRRENYSDEVIEKYEYIKEQLSRKAPDGRLTIFEGQPGTGKTYLLRGLINELPKIQFIYIPSHFVASISDPQFIQALIANKNRNVGYDDAENSDEFESVVLLLEDADLCLVPRMGDNVSSISSLLNLSDGILGSVLDLRIVATTNAKLTNIDEAIMRPGRLLEQVDVGKHPHNEAEQIFKSLFPDLAFETEKDELSLAEIYKLGSKVVVQARIKKPRANAKIERKMGFE